MRLVASLLLYTALGLGANAADTAALAALRQGDMIKLTLTAPGTTIPEGTLLDEGDGEHPLTEWRGKYLLVNFWATWCAPCRAEMAALDRLQADLGSDRFAVLTIATGRNPVPAIHKFFAEEAITHLPILRDPRQAFAGQMGVMALPVTVLIGPDGTEIGRVTGDAAWDGPEAKALIAAMIAE